MSTEVKDVVARLRHAITTAANDDLSEPMTEKRSRHVARMTAMDEAASLLESLSSQVDRAVALISLLNKGLVGLTPSGSEYFVREALLDTYVADIDKCVNFVRERRNSDRENIASTISRATAAEGRVALLEEERDEQRKIIAAFVQRFEVYAGPNDMHAGKHDLELLTLARARLGKGGQ